MIKNRHLERNKENATYRQNQKTDEIRLADEQKQKERQIVGNSWTRERQLNSFFNNIFKYHKENIRIILTDILLISQVFKLFLFRNQILKLFLFRNQVFNLFLSRNQILKLFQFRNQILKLFLFRNQILKLFLFRNQILKLFLFRNQNFKIISIQEPDLV